MSSMTGSTRRRRPVGLDASEQDKKIGPEIMWTIGYGSIELNSLRRIMSRVYTWWCVSR
jgi:hypothetical protein